MLFVLDVGVCLFCVHFVPLLLSFLHAKKVIRAYITINLVQSCRYVTMGINLGNLAALRTFRVLRALKTVAIVPVSLHFTLFSLYIHVSKKENFLVGSSMTSDIFIYHKGTKNYCGCRNRISEEFAGRHHPHHVFTICVCIDGASDLHGRTNAKMYQGLSRRRHCRRKSCQLV